MVDLDSILDPRPHDDFNKTKSDDELIEIYVSRKVRGKKTWQVEREIQRRPGLMERCLAALKKRSRVLPEERTYQPVRREDALPPEECVRAFNEDHPFERTVFVMMRFEGGDPGRDAKLSELFDFITLELRDYNLGAVRADGKDYSRGGDLWENVQIYMHGCEYGIAVLEDLYSNEVNLNVILEYGYISALGKRVLLLTSKSFRGLPTDLSTKLWKEFEFGNRSSVRAAIEAWMVDLQIKRIRT